MNYFPDFRSRPADHNSLAQSTVVFGLHFFAFFVGKMTEVQVQSREIPVLETVEDIERRREQVLRRYAEFKEATRLKRLRLEEAKRYHQWKRDVDECEIWINEKLQIASDESFKDATNLQVSSFKISRLLVAL